MSNKPTKSSSHPAPIRALALALAILVASGVVVYLVTFFLNLFGIA